MEHYDIVVIGSVSQERNVHPHLNARHLHRAIDPLCLVTRMVSTRCHQSPHCRDTNFHLGVHIAKMMTGVMGPPMAGTMGFHHDFGTMRIMVTAN
jgi:hypothetical protein